MNSKNKFNSKKTPFLRNPKIIIVFFFTFLGLLILPIFQKFFMPFKKSVIVKEPPPSPLTLTYERSDALRKSLPIQESEAGIYFIDDSSKSGFLRGGGTGNIMTFFEGPSKSTLRTYRGSSITSQAEPASKSETFRQKKVQTFNQNESLTETLTEDDVQISTKREGLLRTNLQNLSGSKDLASLSREEVQEVYDKVLSASVFSCENGKGKTIKLDYKGRFSLSGPLKPVFDVINGYVNAWGSSSIYQNVNNDYKIFVNRLSYLQNLFTKVGNPHHFQIRTNWRVNGEELSMSLDADHLEGIKAHKATDRTKDETITILIPHYLHEKITSNRKTVEYDWIFDVPVNNQASVVIENKMMFAKNAGMDTYYQNLSDDTELAIDLIPPEYYPPELPKEKVQNVYRNAISIQGSDYIATRAALGMTEPEMLAELYASCGADNNISDIKRLTSKIKEKVLEVALSQGQLNLADFDIPGWAQRTIEQSTQMRQCFFFVLRSFSIIACQIKKVF